MPKCFFCACEIPKGFGKLFATKTGDIYWFCSSKCERNHKLGRSPHKTCWVKKKKQKTAA